MPYSPQAAAAAAATTPLAPDHAGADHSGPDPEDQAIVDPETGARSREAAPYQQPAPPADPAPQTVVLPPDPPVNPPPAQQRSWDQPPAALAPTPKQPSRTQQRLQVLGLGALAAGVVAWAPYAGTMLVAMVVLALRTLSVARQRHGRRRLMRGRARWYDVPTTALSTPGYLLLALLGTLMLVVSAFFTGIAMFALAYLLGQPATVGLVMAGLGFAPVLWWGPGSSRVREMVRVATARTSRTEFGGWFVVGMAVLGTAVMLGLLLSSGPNWAPAAGGPWR
jgi:hypothetical protein